MERRQFVSCIQQYPKKAEEYYLTGTIIQLLIEHKSPLLTRQGR